MYWRVLYLIYIYIYISKNNQIESNHSLWIRIELWKPSPACDWLKIKCVKMLCFPQRRLLNCNIYDRSCACFPDLSIIIKSKYTIHLTVCYSLYLTFKKGIKTFYQHIHFLSGSDSCAFIRDRSLIICDWSVNLRKITITINCGMKRTSLKYRIWTVKKILKHTALHQSTVWSGDNIINVQKL